MKGTLVKRVTDDGYMDVEDDVPTGKVYEVIPGSRRWATLRHESGAILNKEIVDIVGGGFFPTELLSFDEDPGSLVEGLAKFLRGES